MSLYSQGSLCFLGKHNAPGQGSVQRGFVGGWWCLEGISCPGQSQPPPLSLSASLGGLFISRMSIMSCHRTGKARETSRKSITERCVDQWEGSRHTLPWLCCPLVVPRTQCYHDEPSELIYDCVCVYRCVHTDSRRGCDDAGGLPRMLRCHSRISVPVGDGEYLSFLTFNQQKFFVWICFNQLIWG